MEADEETAPSPYAARWRRVCAALIDYVLLAAVCLGVGTALAAELAALGPWARLIGLALGLAYFGVLNRRVSGERTRAMAPAPGDVTGERGRTLGMPATANRMNRP